MGVIFVLFHKFVAHLGAPASLPLATGICIFLREKLMHDILVVDDNSINRQLAVYLLKKGGYEVYEAESGQQAFDFLKSQTPDVILLDIQLPEIDGLEVLKRIRSNSSTKDVTVIALTAYTMRGDKEKFETAGFDGYLPKPIEPRTFARQILEIYSS